MAGGLSSIVQNRIRATHPESVIEYRNEHINAPSAFPVRDFESFNNFEVGRAGTGRPSWSALKWFMETESEALFKVRITSGPS